MTGKTLTYILLLLLPCGVLKSQNIFQLQNPGIRPEPGFAINRINGNIFFGGSYGLLLKSTNGGVNWTEISLNTKSDIRDIISQGINNGLILTIDSSLYKTSNSGLNWIKIVSFSFGVNDIASASINHIFLSTSGYAGKSSDGGLNWSYFNPDPGADNNYFACYFYDSTLGYLSAINTASNYTLIFKTTNSGLNWNKINTAVDNFIVQELYFVNTSTGWAAGSRFGNLFILKTTNGGENWLEQFAYQNDASVNGMYFQNPTTGYIATNRRIIRTIDGGSGWYDYILDNDITASYFDNDTLIHYSDLNGRVIYINGIVHPDTLLGKNSYRVDKIIIASEYNIWISGPGYRHFKSTDGGISWKYDNNGNEFQIKKTFFVNSSTGFALAGRGKVLSTTNFGDSWLTLFDTTAEFSNLFFLNPNTGWVSGNGMIMRTLNGGFNWTRNIIPGEILLLWFNDTFTGYSILNDSIQKSTNSGASWHSQNNFHIKDFCFINSNTGWSLNYNDSMSTINKTTDGGTNYSLLSRLPLSVYKVLFLNSLTGYIADERSVGRTTDGGNTWKSVNYPVSDYLKIHDFNFLNTGTGWFCGDNSLIFKTNNGSSININNLTLPYKPIEILTLIYPNPFNSQTRIVYYLPLSGSVRITVYNITGQEVFEFNSEFEQKGKHELNFDGSHLASGIYFVILTNEKQTGMGKMILIK